MLFLWSITRNGKETVVMQIHLLSDRGDTCSTSATWSYRQQDLEEKDESVSESVNPKAVCRTAPATPGLLKI